MRNIEKEINLVKTKLAETEKSYQKEQRSLGELSDRSVKLIADNIVKPTGQREKEIEEVADQTKELKDKIELTPRILEALKEKIALLEKEKSDQILQGKTEEMEKIGLELGKISKQFIEHLKLAIKENSEIRSLWASWNKLKEEIEKGSGEISQFKTQVSIGSEEMLGILGILVGEYEKNIIRKQSVFNRIRL